MKDIFISALIVIGVGILLSIFACRYNAETDKYLATLRDQKHPCEVKLGKEIHIFHDCKMQIKDSL